ncbi:ABC transporter substrate-binding protein [Teichococcus vastitatis]|uniref:Extracellular solute-binding protein n=1 Tax=Teichococcus vastitatis TaxID=2307076 RepID=A0ABS9W9F5_9PROT|nr:extracellular solute-binding protein [Pseudoroseomonas vastitatis]MCI0755928.1 extracellular solute-binding protein [Pseudoroseomonas vastitatis]
MTRFTRRDALTLGAGGLLAAGLPRLGHSAIPMGNATPPALKVESGASLRVLRPTKFVDADETVFRANTQKFTAETGVQVRVDFAGWEDLRPQTAVAAQTGAGPDVVVAWADDPHIYADKVLDLTELAGYLGQKYGGWLALPQRFGKKWGTDQWVALPMGGSGGPCVYRISWAKEAGFDSIPTDHAGFLKLCQQLKANGHPAGFALGNAVGDGNAYCNWLLWSHGGMVVDESGKVAINSPETLNALRYARELYQTFIPGTLSWGDVNNNRAFAAGEVGLTQNGVSMYFALKNDPRTASIAEDTGMARMPLAPGGKMAENVLLLNAMVFKHTRYPNAAKEYLRFMMEAEQYDAWLTGCGGYWSHPLGAYAQSAVWSSDPKLAVYRDTNTVEFWSGYKGPINAASGSVAADYVVVQMFAAASSGQSTPEEAVREAERRARRYYR